MDEVDWDTHPDLHPTSLHGCHTILAYLDSNPPPVLILKTDGDEACHAPGSWHVPGTSFLDRLLCKD